MHLVAPPRAPRAASASAVRAGAAPIAPTRCAALALLAATLLVPTPGAAQSGPPSGSLVIVGGAMQDPEIVRAFLDLAGGPDAKIVVVPTAGGAEDAAYGPECRCIRQLEANGATNLTVLHTYDPAVAETEAFVEPLLDADGVWFTGGRQWRLADSYLGTRTEAAFHAVLERGGVIGGSSAGASIQADFMVRGDTRGNRAMIGDHTEGFGFMTGVGIDQHLLKRNRHFDLLEVIEARPDLLGIGLDEDTAIIVEGDEFRVIGSGYVAIYDAQADLDMGGDFYFMAPGDRFEISTRTPMRGERDRPVERVRGGGGG
ncbi:MAG: cyanophycinase [Longimicrobiales bacterium]|nr:cyanophycinase [Longimicrobiales bacterium]